MMFSIPKALVALVLAPVVLASHNFYPDTLAELAERGLGECHDCSCFTCDAVAPKADGTLDITVGHCKDGSISWMCCVGYDGGEGNCDTIGPCTPDAGEEKCNTIQKGTGLVVNIPATATTFQINTHDGQTAGDADMNNNVCGGNGNQGGGCAKDGATAHCLVDFDVATDCGFTPEATTEAATTPEATTEAATTPEATTEAATTPEATTEAATTPEATTEAATTPEATTEAATTNAPPASTSGGSFGDPHIKTWGGDQFDFHGGCDLVLVNSPNFLDGVGMEVHIRTKIRTWWSYIDSAVIRIGEDTFEVQGGTNTARYWINGTPGAITESGMLESTVGGFPIQHKVVSKKQQVFRFMDFPQGIAISFETFNDFVRVNLRSDHSASFQGAMGLMGAYPNGDKVARDGKTLMDKDTNAFGQEWQVRANEVKLFHSLEGPQNPESCIIPTATERKGRRLGEGLDLKDAQVACARVSPEDRDACIFDVLATNDKDMAGSY